MCCEGCRAVAELIAGVGLEGYYQYRREPALKPTASDNDEWHGYAQPSVAAQYVRQETAQRCSATVLLDGLRCAACAWLIDRMLRREAGVIDISVNTATGRAHLVWSPQQINFAELLRSLSRLGYRPTPINPESLQQHVIDERRTMLKRLGVAGLGMMQVMMYVLPLYVHSDRDEQVTHYLQIVSLLLTTPVLFYAGWPFLANAARAVRLKSISMDVPVAIALLLAYLASAYNTLEPNAANNPVYFDSLSMFIFLLTLGRFVEMVVRHRSNSVTDALARVQPRIAHRILNSTAAVAAIEDVNIAQLSAGNEVLVRVGEAVPADGVVVKGCSRFNEALLTGESVPVLRQTKERVMAGTINVEAPVHVKVTATGAATVLSGVVALLERGQADKPHIALAADRAARVFLRWVLAATVMVGLAWLYVDPHKAFSAVLAVLVATCPCALSLAAPAVVASTCSALARCGLLVTRADAIERLAKVDHLVFDKTGTLTNGDIAMTGTTVLGALSATECGAIAAALERGVEHPIAHAFTNTTHNSLLVDDVKVIAGAGVQGSIDGVVYRLGTPAFVAALRREVSAREPDSAVVMLGTTDAALASFHLADSVRPEAALAIKELRDLGVQSSMLSGDAFSAVVRVAIECGIDHYQARLTPAAKLAALQATKHNNQLVGMVGDGINDAPVLSAAAVSIAMGAGTALAQASADVVLMSNSLRALPQAIEIARYARRVMQQNLIWATLYNLTALPLAALGLVSPWLAAAGMSLSSVLVVLNATRVLHAARIAPQSATPPASSLGAVALQPAVKAAA